MCEKELITLGPQKIYRGKNLNEISFPLGGIGTGGIGLTGNGSLRDFEIFNRPNFASLMLFLDSHLTKERISWFFTKNSSR